MFIEKLRNLLFFLQLKYLANPRKACVALAILTIGFLVILPAIEKATGVDIIPFI